MRMFACLHFRGMQAVARRIVRLPAPILLPTLVFTTAALTALAVATVGWWVLLPPAGSVTVAVLWELRECRRQAKARPLIPPVPVALRHLVLDLDVDGGTATVACSGGLQLFAARRHTLLAALTTCPGCLAVQAARVVLIDAEGER